jgi:hypothetical protein
MKSMSRLMSFGRSMKTDRSSEQPLDPAKYYHRADKAIQQIVDLLAA